MEVKRVFIIVLDSFGIGAAPDAALFGDAGSNTLASVSRSRSFSVPNMQKLGLFNIQGVEVGNPAEFPEGAYARLTEKSKGKDTTTGHWELAGLVSEQAMPTFPNGFPDEVITELERRTGRGILCNKPYSGTQVIVDYGREQLQTGKLIVYTSADSVLQIAAHEDCIPLEELYRCCTEAREVMQGKYAVGRVIARPFLGEYPDFYRTSERRDYSLRPPGRTVPAAVADCGMDSIGIGKISDIFAGEGITRSLHIDGNKDGMDKAISMLDEDFRGLCFVNLVDFDSQYGHRNDVDGYAQALTDFDMRLGEFMRGMRQEDILFITADHGCDPGFEGTDHTREYVPMLAFGDIIKPADLGTRGSFADLGATVLEALGIDDEISGESFWKQIC